MVATGRQSIARVVDPASSCVVVSMLLLDKPDCSDSWGRSSTGAVTLGNSMEL